LEGGRVAARLKRGADKFARGQIIAQNALSFKLLAAFGEGWYANALRIFRIFFKFSRKVLPRAASGVYNYYLSFSKGESLP
jgi:hypothetical protein